MHILRRMMRTNDRNRLLMAYQKDRNRLLICLGAHILRLYLGGISCAVYIGRISSGSSQESQRQDLRIFEYFGHRFIHDLLQREDMRIFEKVKDKISLTFSPQDSQREDTRISRAV